MEKIAIISDIHGNFEALKTVLEDIKKKKINKIYCLGDIIAKGNHCEDCIKLIKENCIIVLKGNCDEFYSSDKNISCLDKILCKRYLWNRKKLSQNSILYLKSLPFSYEFYMSGRLIRLFHAHPMIIDKPVLDISDVDTLYQMFLPSNNTKSDLKADIVIYGHIHRQYLRKLYNRIIMNTGSVGNSFDVFQNESRNGNVKNTTVANYLIISGNLDSLNIDDEISYEFISLPYDIDRELEDNVDNIEASDYENEIRYGRYRDMKKVNSFINSLHNR